MDDSDDFATTVLAVVRSLPAGAVASYGEVAMEAGRPGAARAVGRILATTQVEVPWWRVVTATGRLVPGNEVVHAGRLRREGVAVRAGRVRPPSAQ